MMNKISKPKRQDQYLIHEGQNAPQSDSQGGNSQSVVLDASPVNLEETLDSETPTAGNRIRNSGVEPSSHPV